MRRLLLPPPAMWSCEPPLVHVLNGDYPEADLKRMSVPGLERLVSRLVQCTGRAASRPKWWPNGLVFTHPLEVGAGSEREIKLIFKQLIVSCCQFFKAHAADENRRARRRPAVVAKKPRPAPAAPTKHQFLHYFRLNSRRAKANECAAPTATPTTSKLAACVHIPFSSDVGRIMAARENHAMSEELKMKRLERSEWYTNKGAPRGADAEFEVSACKVPGHAHLYKMPKRQRHHKRQSLHNVNFLAQFCKPVSVVVERLDLDKVKSNSDKGRELVVMIRDTEKMSCDLRRNVNAKIVRTSPRLRQNM